MGAGSSGNPIWFVFWLLVLFLLGFWIALFCAGWFIIIGPLAVCLPALKGVADVLMKGITLPVYCAENMMSMSAPF